MTPRNNTVSIIIVSLIFAVAIALSTYIFADTGNSQTIMYLLIYVPAHRPVVHSVHASHPS